MRNAGQMTIGKTHPRLSKDPHDSCDHFHIKISVVGWGCVGGKREKLIKNPINYNYLVTSSMTSPSWIIPHMKALDLKFCIASRLSLATTWWRSRAIRKISKNGFSATPSGRILMIYTLKVHKYYCDSDDVCIMTFWGQKRSNVGHNRKIRV